MLSPPTTPTTEKSKALTPPSQETPTKRQAYQWLPSTPTSLLHRKKGHSSYRLHAEVQAKGRKLFVDGHSLKGAVTGFGHPISSDKALSGKTKNHRLGLAIWWFKNIVGVHCPFCHREETHTFHQSTNDPHPRIN
jgi:hypothetical protein